MWNLKEFTSVYARFRESGLSVRDFCHNECIHEAKFYYWQKKFRDHEAQEPAPSGFIPLIFPEGHSSGPTLPSTAQHGGVPSTDSSYEILYPNGVILRLPVSIDFHRLQSLIFLSR